MSVPAPTLLHWLHRHGGFPQHRLPTQAELLLCFAAAAESDGQAELAVQNGGPIARKDTARDAALRQHQLRRAQVHFKCDNSAKV